MALEEVVNGAVGEFVLRNKDNRALALTAAKLHDGTNDTMDFLYAKAAEEGDAQGNAIYDAFLEKNEGDAIRYQRELRSMKVADIVEKFDIDDEDAEKIIREDYGDENYGDIRTQIDKYNLDLKDAETKYKRALIDLRDDEKTILEAKHEFELKRLEAQHEFELKKAELSQKYNINKLMRIASVVEGLEEAYFSDMRASVIRYNVAEQQKQRKESERKYEKAKAENKQAA